MTTRKYSSRSQQTTLTAGLTSSGTSATVVSGTALLGGVTVSAGEIFTVVIDPDTALEEIVDVTAVSTNTLTIVRGIDGSTGQAHSAGAVVRHMAIGRDYREANTHIENTTTAHGLTIANVLETTDTNMITTAMLQSNAVTTAKITDANVTTGKIADSAITSAKIADLGIATGDIADLAITTGKIAAEAVTTAKIPESAITNSRIAADAVTADKIANDAVGTTEIANLAVTTAKIADSAITSAKIADGTIVAGDIADGAITSAKILDATIATGDLADGAVTSAKIADATIVNADISGTAGIAYTKLSLGGTITSADIVDGTIVASDIANGTITAAKMVSDPYARANHTGTQTASTVSDFDTQVRTSRLDQMAAPTASVAMNAQKITGVADPTLAQDASTKAYVDAQVNALVDGAPGTLNTLNEIATAISSGGSFESTVVLKSGSTMTGALVLNADPSANLGAATKQYVDAVAGSATAAAASAAAAATTYDNFDDRYLGAKSSAPTLDNDGNALITGAIYWNSVDNAMYAWTGSAWGSISSTAAIFRYRFTASGGETSESGVDDNGLTLSYIPGKEQVYLNGVLLARTSDYTASNGTSITSLAALTAGDILEVITFTAFDVATAVPNSSFTAKGTLLVGTGAGTYAAQAVGSNGQVLAANSAQADGVEWIALADTTKVSKSGGDTITVSSGTTVPLTIQNNGTGNSFVVNDVASDTTPFVIDQAGQVGIGITPSYGLDVAQTGRFGGTTPSAAAVILANGAIYNSTTLNWNYANQSIIRNAANTSTPRFIEMLLDGDSNSATTIGATNSIWGIYDSSPTTGSLSSTLNGKMAYGAYAGHKWYVNGTERMSIASDGALNAPLITNAQTGTTYTFTLADAGKLVEFNNAGAITVTIPLNSSVSYPIGTQINLLQTGAGQVTVAAGGTTLNATPGLKLRAQWSSATLIKRAGDTWVLVGDLSA